MPETNASNSCERRDGSDRRRTLADRRKHDLGGNPYDPNFVDRRSGKDRRQSVVDDAWVWIASEAPADVAATNGKPPRRDRCPTSSSNSSWPLTSTNEPTPAPSRPGPRSWKSSGHWVTAGSPSPSRWPTHGSANPADAEPAADCTTVRGSPAQRMTIPPALLADSRLPIGASLQGACGPTPRHRLLSCPFTANAGRPAVDVQLLHQLIDNPDGAGDQHDQQPVLP